MMRLDLNIGAFDPVRRTISDNVCMLAIGLLIAIEEAKAAKFGHHGLQQDNISGNRIIVWP